MARQRGRVVDLRIAGEDRTLVSLPLTPDGEACCAVERLRELAADSIRLRTRALTTTMFARYFLGDLFIHGIGGAKYDELGDEISRRFFGIEPPGFLTMSLSLWLDLPNEAVTRDDLAKLDRVFRDLTFNPDRHLHEPYPESLRTYINGKREAMAGPTTSRRERVARAVAIRRYNDAMQPWVEEMRAEVNAGGARSGPDFDRAGSRGTGNSRRCSIPGIDYSMSCGTSRRRWRRGRYRVGQIPAADAGSGDRDSAGHAGVAGVRRPRSAGFPANLLYFPTWIAAAPFASTYNENEASSRASKRAPLESGRRAAPRASKSQYGRFHEILRVRLPTADRQGFGRIRPGIRGRS